MAVSGHVRHEVSITTTTTTGTAGTAKDEVSLGRSVTAITDGAGNNQWSKVASGTLSLLASTPQELDLSAVVTAHGTVNFSTVKYFWIRSDSTTAADTVTIDAGATNGWTAPWGASGAPIIFGGGLVIFHRPLSTGYVVDGTNKTVEFTPSAAAHTIPYFIAGT